MQGAQPGVRALSGSAQAFAADYSYTPPGRNHLFVPGPSNLNERVQRAMMRQSENHRDPHFPFLANSVLKDLKARQNQSIEKWNALLPSG